MNRRDLDGVRMCELMHGLVGGACDETATASLLVALAMKGETADELATAAAVLREYMIAVSRRPRRPPRHLRHRRRRHGDVQHQHGHGLRGGRRRACRW